MKYFLIFLLCQFINAVPIDEPITFENAGQLDSPWLALIEVHSQICGGSLIHQRYILTAAHCFDYVNPEDFEDKEKLKKSVTIKLGEWKTDMNPDCDENVDGQICDPVVVIHAKSIILHENYVGKKLDDAYADDIAMIKLAWPARQTDLIQSIKLPDGDECDGSVENEIWTVTGFGQTPERIFSKIKKKIDLRMISNEECEDIINDDDKGFYHSGTHICGKGTRDESTCIGDSGSAATMNTTKGPILQGIVSFGSSECGTRGAPTGLLKVACYADWIQETIREFKRRDGEDDSGSKENDHKSTEEDNKSGNDNDDDDDDDWDRNIPNVKRRTVSLASRTVAQHVRIPQ